MKTKKAREAISCHFVGANLPSVSEEFQRMLLPFILSVILLPAHPASFAHKFLFQRVPGCNSFADFSLKIVLRTHKFAVGTH